MTFIIIASDQQRQALERPPIKSGVAVGRVAQRAWMVLWSSENILVPDIAHRLHLKPKTVHKWLTRYQQHGCEGLLDLPRTGRPRKVTAVAQQSIFTQINQPPSTFGYVFAIWTVVTLRAHLRTHCSLLLSRWRVRDVLHRLRFRFSRPKIAVPQVDPNREAVNQYIGRRIAQATPNTAILVEDETDIRLFPLLRRMWMRIGQQVRLVAPQTNQKRSIFGTINIQTGEVFHRIYNRKRTLEMICFLEDLVLHYCGRPVLLIVDHASIHKSKALRAWLLDHPQIEVIYLPKYAAHRDNPIEKLWWHLKGYAAANRCCRSMSELISVVERYFEQLTPEHVFQLVA